MADVYLARDLILDGESCQSGTAYELQTDPITVARFQRESESDGGTEPSSIVRIADIGEEGQQYLAMEYVAGLDLKPLYQKKMHLYQMKAVRLMGQILPLLCVQPHTRGIIHRDFKTTECPSLTPDGTAKVSDFGIAAVVFAETSRRLQTNSMLGSVHYLSPEQARDRKLRAK